MSYLTDEQCITMQALIKRKYPNMTFSHDCHWLSFSHCCLLCGRYLISESTSEHALQHLEEHNLLSFI